ncbi:MAG: NAD-dependent epimerase/dehydratase family protein [Acetobacteraceae bacterium]|nr:NAD-dependent epimerase/dehydratase family protein [Acetobacteraceae bacterium]
MKRRETVLITGAGGFLGGTIVEALHFSGEREPRAGISRWTSAPRIARMPVPIVQCDVLKPAQLAAAMEGVDHVIHCAVGEDLSVIVDGTANVLEAARAAGVRRVVHISSVAVYGAATGEVDEAATAPPGTVTPYGAAKIRAEAACMQAAAGGQSVVVLRPSIVYGPFAGRWTVLYAMRLRAGRWGDLGDAGEGKCNLVHVHDVARYAVASLDAPGVEGEVFNVNGPEVVSWNEYFQRFNDGLGLPPLQPRTAQKARMAALLTQPVRIAGKFALKNFSPQLIWLSQNSDRLKRLMKETELTLRCTPNGDELSLFGLDAVYPTTKAERAFGMAPRIDLSEGLAMTVAWLDHMGEAA